MDTPDLSGYTLLIAEDDPASYKYFQATLKKSGAEMHHATNGNEAIELFKQNPAIDLVLMDAMMPELSGFDATKEIKKIKPEIPVIMLTAYANFESIRKSVASGCNDYLAKPIMADVLKVAVKKWLPAK